MIDCREAVRRMWAYLDHGLDAEPAEEFESHLETCRRCCGELEFSRALRRLVAEKASEPLPERLHRRLRALLEHA